MEINGIIIAKSILLQLKDGLYKPEEVNKEIDVAIQSLNNQVLYLKGNNPNKMFGYPKTYNKE